MCLSTGCVDGTGATCSPIDEDADDIDSPYCAIPAHLKRLQAKIWMGAEIDCYCPTSDCQLISWEMVRAIV